MASKLGTRRFPLEGPLTRHRLRNPHLQLGLVFFLLVLVPSCLLGYFSLRAVENERRASAARLLADRAGDAEIAARAIHGELATLENAWKGLVPRNVGWESRADEMITTVSGVKGLAFVRAGHLLHVSGRQLYPPDTPTESAATPLELQSLDAEDAERFQELLAAAEAAEFDGDDAAAAQRAYEALLAVAQTPGLQAIARAGIGRAHIRARHWDAAIQVFEVILRENADAYDLDNQPLRLQALQQIARAQQERGAALAAAEALVTLYEDLVQSSDAIGRLQYDIFVERIEERLGRLLPRPSPPEWRALQARYDAVRGRPKKQVGSQYFAHKLSRKLIRASLDGLAYSTEVRYVSDTAEGRPFLLAYLYLPDASGTTVAGLVGFEIDLEEMNRTLLPAILERQQRPGDARLAMVDGEGRRLEGGHGIAGPPLVSRNLDFPLDFWSVAVWSPALASGGRPVDFRTKVFLYFVFLLLVTIAAGTTLLVVGWRRQAQLARLKTGLVSRVSHELRTPLTSIRMYGELLEEGGDSLSPVQRLQHLKTIRRECDRLQRLIDQVLDFARRERGIAAAPLEFEEIGALVQGVAEGFRAQAENGGFQYTIEVEPDLPELRLDADAVRQALLNLLANAVQYSEDERRLAVRAFRRGAEVAVQVQDHGIGVDPLEQKRIFEDFYRGEAGGSSHHAGLGLGLAVVRRVAEAHRGRVTVDSRRGQGATFTLWFPVQPPGEARAQRSAARWRFGELRHG